MLRPFLCLVFQLGLECRWVLGREFLHGWARMRTSFCVPSILQSHSNTIIGIQSKLRLENNCDTFKQKCIDYIEKWQFMVICLYNLYIFVFVHLFFLCFTSLPTFKLRWQKVLCALKYYLVPDLGSLGGHQIMKTRLFKYIENFTVKNWKFSDKTRGPWWSYITHLTKQICVFTVEVSAKFTALGFLYKLYSTNHPHPPPPHPQLCFLQILTTWTES